MIATKQKAAWRGTIGSIEQSIVETIHELDRTERSLMELEKQPSAQKKIQRLMDRLDGRLHHLMDGTANADRLANEVDGELKSLANAFESWQASSAKLTAVLAALPIHGHAEL